jgi:putative toxin-antitoxin system antitoxin component (TIGR02293 family)
MELLTTLGMPQRTVSRRLKEHKKLTTEESDRLYRALEIMRSAVETFGDPDLAAKWLKEPNPAISGATPLSLLDTQPGRDQVATLLGRIEHGIYT